MIFDLRYKTIGDAVSQTRIKTLRKYLSAAPSAERSRAACFALADVVTCSRDRRRGGLEGEEMRRMLQVTPDSEPDVPLGPDPDARAEALWAALTRDERDRAERLVKWYREAAVYWLWDRAASAGLPTLLRRMILHPHHLKYILSGDGAGLETTPADRAMWFGKFLEVNKVQAVNE